MSATVVEYLTATEAAELLRVSTGTIYRAIDGGSLPAVRLGPRATIRIPASAITGRARARARTSLEAVEPGAVARGEENA
jgi:excisionase family DNA binding protein